MVIPKVLMIEKIFRTVAFAALTVVLISSVLFSGLTSAAALVKGWTPSPQKSLPLEENVDNPLGIVIERSEASQNNENEKPMKGMSMKEIFGDEQIYPFEQGIGGHHGGDGAD